MNQKSSRDLYLRLSQSMKDDLGQVTGGNEPKTELEIVKHYCIKWNRIIVLGYKWSKKTKEDLKYSTFKNKMQYEIREETLKHGRAILKEIKSYKLKDTKARKKQTDFIKELEDRILFLSSRKNHVQ